MARRWRYGWLVLLGGLLAVFLVIRNMKKIVSTNKAKTQRNNNPFAIIQAVPDKWRGLAEGSSGFLTFTSPVYGVRAGYINLVNGYLKKGFDSIEKIFPRYAPASDGNKPEAYISFVEKFTGIPRNSRITEAKQIYDLGRAIERVEAGKSWVDAEDWDQGWTLAIPIVKTYTAFDLKTQTQKATAIAGNIPL